MNCCLTLKASMVILLGSIGTFTGAATGAKTGIGNVNEFKYNRIFSSWFPAIPPSTTQRWLEQLEQVLAANADAGQRIRRDQVERLLSFDRLKTKCLADESDHTLAANLQHFQDEKPTLTIAVYIRRCMVRLLRDCDASFARLTSEAVERIAKRGQQGANLDRVIRFGQLVGRSTQQQQQRGASRAILAFIIEQATGNSPRPLVAAQLDRQQFEGLFKQWIDGVCETIRTEFRFMRYFGVLFTWNQIETMDRPVREWFKARNACKAVLDERTRTMDRVFGHLIETSQVENALLEYKYRRVFEYATWALKPEETLKRFEWLEEQLAARVDEVSKRRLGEVRRMMELGRTIVGAQRCPHLEAAKQVSEALYDYHRRAPAFTILRYLKSLRDQLFTLCRTEFTAKVKATEERVGQQQELGPARDRVFRLKELIVGKFDPASYGQAGLYALLLSFMDEQQASATGAPLDPELERAEFNKRLKTVVLETCRRIHDEFRFFWETRKVWRREVIQQMDQVVREWFVAFNTCQTVYLLPATVEIGVYRRLVARAKMADGFPTTSLCFTRSPMGREPSIASIDSGPCF